MLHNKAEHNGQENLLPSDLAVGQFPRSRLHCSWQVDRKRTGVLRRDYPDGRARLQLEGKLLDIEEIVTISPVATPAIAFGGFVLGGPGPVLSKSA